jgi:RimJ/RimL family protein N-acetyltransferase
MTKPSYTKPATVLETERLRLREMGVSDARFMHELMNEPAFINNVADRGIKTIDDAARWLEQKILPSYKQYGFGFYGVELLDNTGALIGICGLVKRDTLEDVDIGYAILDRYTGRGYAYESAKAMLEHGRRAHGLRRIIAITSGHNVVSIHLLEKLGLHFERMLHLPEFERPLMLFACETEAHKSAADPGQDTLRRA